MQEMILIKPEPIEPLIPPETKVVNESAGGSEVIQEESHDS